MSANHEIATPRPATTLKDPVAAPTPLPSAPVPPPARITLAHALPITAFPALGVVLQLTDDMPTAEILELLGACGGIGAAAVALVTGGRHLGAAMGRAVRAAFDKNA